MNRCRHCGDRTLLVYPIDPHKKTKFEHIDNHVSLCVICGDKRSKVNNASNSQVLGVILCGGTGSRLAPLTITHNKHELPVGTVPMVFHPIMTLRALGIKEVVVVLDRHMIGGIIEMLGSGKEFGMDFTYRVQEGPGGIADALLLAAPYARGRNLAVILGDNVFDQTDKVLNSPFALSELNKAAVFLKEVRDPTQYGVATINYDHQVVEIIEKPKNPKSNYAVTGLYWYTSEVFDIAQNLRPSNRDELEISDINDYYAKKGELTYRVLEGFWGDAGSSFEGYQEVCAHVISKKNCEG